MSFRLGLKFFRQRRNDTKHYGRTRNFGGKCENLSRATHSARHHGSIIIFIQVSRYVYLTISFYHVHQSNYPNTTTVFSFVCTSTYVSFQQHVLRQFFVYTLLTYIPGFVYFKLSIFIIKMHGKIM